ncbi:MAG: SDR family oxidoreductase [Gemmatimonadales bacterium]
MTALAGRTAIVTGASRGIGSAIARGLADGGARVGLIARTRPALEQLRAELGESAVVIECDVTDIGSVSSAAARVREAFGGAPDIIVNNAGLFRVAPLDTMSPEDFVGSVQTNLVAPFLVLHEFLAEMRARQRGHVVTIGSVADREIFPENAAYAASKFGVRALHEVLRLELNGTGVRATLVSPAAVNTELWNGFDTGANQQRFPTRDNMLDADAVARAVMFAVTQPPSVNVDELRLSRA